MSENVELIKLISNAPETKAGLGGLVDDPGKAKKLMKERAVKRAWLSDGTQRLPDEILANPIGALEQFIKALDAIPLISNQKEKGGNEGLCKSIMEAIKCTPYAAMRRLS